MHREIALQIFLFAERSGDAATKSSLQIYVKMLLLEKLLINNLDLRSWMNRGLQAFGQVVCLKTISTQSENYNCYGNEGASVITHSMLKTRSLDL